MVLALHNLKSYRGARRRAKRVGRGLGTGKGTYSGRGAKGQKSRSGSRKRPGFEGGRTPLWMQLPKKRGYKSIHGKPAIVNIEVLEKKFESGATVSPKLLLRESIVQNIKNGVKILGEGSLTKKFTVTGFLVSASAKEKILKAGGSIVESRQKQAAKSVDS